MKIEQKYSHESLSVFHLSAYPEERGYKARVVAIANSDLKGKVCFLN